MGGCEEREDLPPSVPAGRSWSLSRSVVGGLNIVALCEGIGTGIPVDPGAVPCSEPRIPNHERPECRGLHGFAALKAVGEASNRQQAMCPAP